MTDPVQSAAPDEVLELASRLHFTVARLSRVLRKQTGTGLSPNLVMALATIDRCGPLPVGQLAEEEQVTAPTATKIADRLHTEGYIERVPDPKDRRVTRLAVSPAGAELLAELRHRKAAWLAEQLAGLDPEDRAAIDTGLTLIADLLLPSRPPQEPKHP